MPDFLTLDDLDAKGKTVLLRADLNVPVENGLVSDDTRLKRLIPTLEELGQKGAKTVILSHFGRPKGERSAENSLRNIAMHLQSLIGGRVAFADDCIGEDAKAAIEKLQNGEYALLENLRFHAGEEKNDPGFAKELASLGEVFINDAFSAAHRAHASTEGLARLLPAYAGRLMEAELKALAAALEKPEPPVIAIVGGAKISTKLDLLNNLVKKVDTLVLGGGMANTFLNAKGINVGKSLCEHDMADQARGIMDKAAAENCEILLPVDGVNAAEFKAGAENTTDDVTALPGDKMMLDLGPKTIKAICEAIENSKTLVWNGPLGAFEISPFEKATCEVAQFAAEQTKAGKLLTVAGGGDTVSALSKAGVTEDFTYISTAGGAFLEWLEGKTLPGVAALKPA